MRRSKDVHLTLLAAAALLATGCHRDCVDDQNRILPDSACRESHIYGYHSYSGHYIWGGSSGGRLGETVRGGSVRGGFGGFHGFASGGA